MQLKTIFSALLTATAVLASPTPTEKRNSNCSPVGISAQSSAAVVRAFRSSGVVPTLIPSINPKVAVSVAYGSKQVNLGNKFLTTETLKAPKLSFSAESGTDPSKTKYAYFLVDPDVPNPDAGVLRMTYLHWAVYVYQALLPTLDFQLIFIQPRRAAELHQNPETCYRHFYQALSPASTQQHRYTFLVYRQPAGYTPDTVALLLRPGFDVNAYAARKGLTLVGGNFLREAITNGIIT